MRSPISSIDRSSSGGDLGLGEPVEQRVVMGVRPDLDQAGRERVGERRPRQRSAAAGERRATFEEVGGDVQRRGHAMLHEHGHREVGEVGGAVVERDRDDGIATRVRIGDAREAVGEGHDVRVSGEKGDLLGEGREREVDLDGTPPTDAVIDQDDEPGRGLPHDVGGRANHLRHLTGGGPCHGADTR